LARSSPVTPAGQVAIPPMPVTLARLRLFYPVLEPIIHGEYQLTFMNLTPRKLTEWFGEPANIEEYVSDVSGNRESVYRFEAGEFLFESSSAGEPFIKLAKLKSPILETRRGIKVGATKADVEKAYGTFLYRSDGEWWTGDAPCLAFVFQGDIVREIRYIFVSE
jgi:hypothetical protein